LSNGNHDNPNRDRERSDRRPDNGEFSDAVDRLERAVRELVSAAKDQTFDRATGFIEDTSRRIESELRFNRVADEEADQERDRRRRRRRNRHGRDRSRYSAASPKTPGLYRDTSDQKIGGVCAGIAHYFGLETWVIRLGALTGLIFLPGVVFPAYWIAYFVMDPPPSSSDASRSSTRSKRRRSERKRGSENGPEVVEATPPASVTPRRSLRNSSADYAQIELRLRRMESFVTSGQYELHKELHKIEREERKDNAR
jgi:phage shock protein C